jgi:hypothetical protein
LHKYHYSIGLTYWLLLMKNCFNILQKLWWIYIILIPLFLGCNLPGLDRFPLDFSTWNLLLRLTKTPSLGGEVSGLLGSGLRLNAEIRTSDSLTNQTLDIVSNGRFQFSSTPPEGATYTITILSQPTNPNQFCEVGGATGTMGRSAVSNILVQCGDSLEISMPTFTPPPGEFSSAINVSISTTETFGKIFYTTNGTNPSCNPDGAGVGTEFTSPILVPLPSLAGLEIRAIVCLPEKSSNVQVGIFRVTNGQLGLVTPSLAPGTYATSPQITTLTPPASPPPGTTIHYTVDGTIPTCSSPYPPDPIEMIVSTTIRAVACAPDWSASNVAEFAYTITGTVTTPTLNFFDNTYPDGINLSLSVPIPGASIRYALTTDGSDPIPNCTSSTLYTSPIPIAMNNTKLSAIGCLAGWTDSTPSPIQTYNFQVANPVISPTPPLSVSTSQLVTASTTTSSVTIRYTFDGSLPDCFSSTTPPTITADNIESDITVRAIACRGGFTPSAVVSGTYTKTGTLSPPTFSPVAGTMPPGNITLGIGGNPAGTEIRYRLDGNPISCSDTLYTAPINLAISTTITAISCRSTPLWNPSSSVSSAYTITGTLATPTFTPTGGTYNNVQSVTIASNPGSTIYYNLTVDGSTPAPPTCGTGLTTQPISVTQNNTQISAIACQFGWADSLVGTVVFTLRPDTPIPDFPNSTSFGNTATISFTSSPGTTFRIVEGPNATPPTDPTCADTDPGTNSITIPAYPVGGAWRVVKAVACRGNFADSLLTSLFYFVNGPVPAPTLSSTLDEANQVTLSANATPPAPGLQALCYRIGTDPECSQTLNGTPNALGGSCALGSTVYNSGAKPILTETSDFRARACSNNHEQSTVVQNTFTISGTVGAVSATPPPPGNFNNDTNITLSSIDSTVIYYRTDGNNPDCTGVGSLSALPFNLQPTSPGAAHVKAIGCAPGISPSPIADFNYTFQAAIPTTASTPGIKNIDETVTMNSATTGATIRYRLDSVTPTDCTDGIEGNSVLLPTAAGSSTPGLRAIACRTNYTTSVELSRDYTFETTTPTTINDATNAVIATDLQTLPIMIRFETSTSGGRMCLDAKPGVVDPICSGADCGAGMIDLGTSGSGTWFYHGGGNIRTAVRVCKANYNPNPTINQIIFSTPPSPTYRSFVSNSSYQGDLGGAIGADNKCNIDINRPIQNAPYLAFLASAGVPTRTTTANNPLLPSSTYIRSEDGLPLFTTNVTGIPPTTLGNAWSTGSFNVWTGFSTTLGLMDNCLGWVNNTTLEFGRQGIANSATATWLNQLTPNCGNSHRLYCVESRYRIWVTAERTIANFGGASGGDAICNNLADANHPQSGTYKALVVIPPDRAPGGTDWPLKPFTAYYRNDRTTLIGITDSLGRFTRLDNTAGLENSFTGIAEDFWTGANGNYTLGNNCGGFAGGGGVVGNTGLSDSVNPFEYTQSFSSPSCGNGLPVSSQPSLLCIEQ